MFDKVRKEMQLCSTVDDAIVKIADTCVNYIEDPWYASTKSAYTTFAAFDCAIAEVVCYIPSRLDRSQLITNVI